MSRGLADAVSLTVVPIFALPFVLYLTRGGSAADLAVCAGVLVTQAIAKLSRRLPVWHPAQLRPPGARDCGAFNNGGSYEGRIGMPSGHVMNTAYVLLSLALLSPGDEHTLLKLLKLALALAWTLAMAWSRVARGCHTVAQVIAGACLGAAFAYATALVVRRLVKVDDRVDRVR